MFRFRLLPCTHYACLFLVVCACSISVPCLKKTENLYRKYMKKTKYGNKNGSSVERITVLQQAVPHQGAEGTAAGGQEVNWVLKGPTVGVLKH